MSERMNKRATTTALKALIAAASVGATIGGWAILPSNDPQTAAVAGAAEQSSQLPALTVPGDNPSQAPSQTPSQAPSTDQIVPTSPDSQLPQVQAPQGFSNRPSPFTRTHSSR